MSTPTKPSIVFCHGIWADGSCWNKLTGPLQAEGYEVIAAQYGLDTNEADVAATRATLGRVHSPAILVGHSYGGAVITAAGTDDRVAGLVYIAALGPDETETSQSEQEKFPQTPLFGQIEVADGRIWMLPSGAPCFCGDLPEEEQKIVWATAYPPSVELFSRNAQGVGWRTKPSWYIVANNDQAVHPELERAAAKRMGATTYDIDSSHVPMLSHPDYVLDVIRTAAAGDLSPRRFLSPCSPAGRAGLRNSDLTKGETGGIRTSPRHTRAPPRVDQRTAVSGSPGRHLRRYQPAGHRGAVREAGG